MRTFTSWKTAQGAETALADLLSQETFHEVRGALAFAAEQHGDQLRPTGDPYVAHLVEALETAVAGAGIVDRDVLVALALHDVVEDTPCPISSIADRFGERVAELVGWVTKPQTPTGGDKREVKRAYLRSLASAPDQAVLVKLADRVSNVQELHRMPEDFQRRYHRETVDFILPLAQREPWFADWFETWRKAWRELEA